MSRPGSKPWSTGSSAQNPQRVSLSIRPRNPAVAWKTQRITVTPSFRVTACWPGALKRR